MSFHGHDEPWREWRAALAGPRMHHGWILAGRSGIGKAAFALAAARELVAEPDVKQPSGDHPDIHLIVPLAADKDEAKKQEDGKPFKRKRSISVDQIREIQHRLFTRPTLGTRRAVIFDSADILEKAAANALLKSLEEPPVGTFFLLVSHRPGRLLPTIRSRCRMLRFPELSPQDVDTILQREAPQADSASRAAAIAAAGGSPGAALDFLKLDLGAMHRLMAEIVQHGDGDFTRRGRLADAMGARPDRQRQLAAIDLARAVLGGEMAQVTRARIPALADAHGELARLTAQAPTYNFDAGLLVMEIGGLLASVAAPRDAADG